MASLEGPPPTMEVTSPPDGYDRTILGDASASARERHDASIPVQGQRLGDFLVLDTLGRGGMGVVVKAYDDKLDRNVAIKVLHPEATRRHKARLLREAQALARLSHPNVVQIYEVGTVGERTFIAMELVAGRTLAQVRSEPRSWRSTVELYLQAARGLAAAHAKGLVHRDFKPDNCILGDDGRVRVLDFGLVREIAATDGESVDSAAGEPDATDSAASHDKGPFSERITWDGAVLGTVAYMSLEQVMGQPADARTDQYSWCASLYEALYGVLPYPAQTLATLMEAMMAERQSTPTGVDLPRRLRRALWRGLSPHPADRWPTMEALIAELEAIMSRRRWWSAGAALALGLGLGGALALTRSQPAPCPDLDVTLDGAWDDDAHHRLAQAFARHGPPDTNTLLPRITTRLDAYAQAWGEMVDESCRATFVTHRQSEERFELRARCLERRRNHAVSAIEALTEADETESIVQSAILPFKLPELRRCADADALSSRAALEQDEQDERHAELRRRLDQVHALRESGRFERALALAEAVRDDAATLQAPRLHAEALEHLGRVQVEGISKHDAKPTLEQAIVEASRVRDDEVAARAWLWLLLATATPQTLSEAEHHALAATAAVDRTGDDLLHAWLLTHLGIMAATGNDPTKAQQKLEEALTLKSQVLGDDHVDVGIAWFNLGMMLHMVGKHRTARKAFQQAESIFKTTVGLSHPYTVYTLIGQCGVEVYMHDYEGAEVLCERAITRLASSPVEPTWEGRARYRMAQTLWKLGRREEARAMAEHAVEVVASEDPTLLQTLEKWLEDPDTDPV